MEAKEELVSAESIGGKKIMWAETCEVQGWI